jgi:hypothetical protein
VQRPFTAVSFLHVFVAVKSSGLSVIQLFKILA